MEIIKNQIKSEYKKDVLEVICTTYFRNFIPVTKKPPTQDVLAGVIEKVFTDKKLFNVFINSLDQKFKELLYKITWEGVVDVFLLEKQNKLKVLAKNYERTYYYSKSEDNLEKPYWLFKVDISKDYDYSKKVYIYSGMIFLPKVIKKLLREIFEPYPEGFILKPDELDYKDVTYKPEETSLKEYKTFTKYLQNSKIKGATISEFVKKINKSELKYLTENCVVKNFFKDPEFINFKSEILIKFFASCYDEINHDKDELASLKSLFTHFEDKAFIPVYRLLLHLRSTGAIERDYHYSSANIQFVTDFLYLIKKMELNKWYSFNQIMNFAKLRDLNFFIVSPATSDRVYFTVDSPEGKKECYLGTPENIVYGFVLPLIKTMLFLFSALGVVDLVYDNALDKKFSLKDPLTTPVDLLKAVRLTDLGAYLIGISDKYEIKNTKKDELKLIFGETDLTIKIQTDDKISSMFLDYFAEKINDKSYKLTYTSFLKDCKTLKDLKNKIALFKKEYGTTYPKIWSGFFDEIIRKHSPFIINTDYVIYDIKQDRELINILVNDEIIKKNILKVENSKIAIKKDDMNKVKKRLEEFGYLL